MPTAMTGWKANDGRWFDDELTATRHEVMSDLRKSFPEIGDRMVQIEKIVDRMAICLSPLALVAEKPPLNAQEPPSGPRTWRDPAAPMDNVPGGWSYAHTSRDDERLLTDTYENDGARVDWRRSNLFWPASMTGTDGLIGRFGKDAPLGCAHEWETDTPCDLVDTCKHCGEQRA